MNIRYANIDDLEIISKYDKHIKKEELASIIKLNRVLVCEKDSIFIGWLRYHLFWDMIPFMSMLYLLDGSRGVGFGSKIVAFWEKEMKRLGYNRVMTSSLSNEEAQHFYRKLGYKDSGCLLLPEEALEIFFVKDL